MSRESATLNAMVERAISTQQSLGDLWPYHADSETGEWTTADGGDWCAGHWIESLRIASERTGERSLLSECRRRVEEITPWRVMDDMFRAPMFYYSAARLAESEQDEGLRALALDVADRVRAMAMPATGGMPIGTQVRVKSTSLASSSIVAVDNVHPNLTLDWYARRVTGDPRFEVGARAHLDFTAEHFLRADGSTIEFIEFNPASGEPVRDFTLLGIDADSCWSRGQAWAVAGYLRAWEELRDDRYLEIALDLWRFWKANCADGSLIPSWDFSELDPDAPRDSSAAAIVAEQLARLAVAEGGSPEASDFLKDFDPLIDELCSLVTTGIDGRPQGMLLEGCFNRPRRFADSHELIWGDFYLLSALHMRDSGPLPC